MTKYALLIGINYRTQFCSLKGCISDVTDIRALIQGWDFRPENISNESVENIEKRIAYIEHILLNKKLVRHVLKKIVKEHNIHWYHLNKHSELVKKTFYKYIKSKLSEAINNYNRQE